MRSKKQIIKVYAEGERGEFLMNEMIKEGYIIKSIVTNSVTSSTYRHGDIIVLYEK